MTQTLKISNVDEDVVDALTERAARHGRSLEEEHRAILLRGLDMERSSFDELAAKMRELTAGRRHTPSEQLMREGRDER